MVSPQEIYTRELNQLRDEVARLRQYAERLERENRILSGRLQALQENEDIEDEDHNYFVSSPTAKCFHRPHCKYAVIISTPRIIEYFSHQEAVDADKKPCKTCYA